MTTPPMTFRVEDLADDERMQNGPMVVFWGQDAEVPFLGDTFDWPAKRQPLRSRLLLRREFRIMIRLQPPEGVDLKQYGQDVARILGIPYGGDPKDHHKATWIPATVYVRNAPQALASAGRVLIRLGKFETSAVQVRVERAP
jgi:hypothetical protein